MLIMEYNPFLLVKLSHDVNEPKTGCSVTYNLLIQSIIEFLSTIVIIVLSSFCTQTTLIEIRWDLNRLLPKMGVILQIRLLTN